MKAHLVEICGHERWRDVLDVPCSTWQWAAGCSGTQGRASVCAGGGSVASALVAFAVEFRTSPKSPPAGLAPPTLDFKSGEKRRHHEAKLITSAERNSNLTFSSKLGLSRLCPCGSTCCCSARGSLTVRRNKRKIKVSFLVHCRVLSPFLHKSAYRLSIIWGLVRHGVSELES